MIAIVDYGLGNTGSIRNMFRRLGISAIVTHEAAEIASADRIVLPGVGSFDRAMENINRLGIIGVLRQRVLEDGVPCLGICLGMQLLAQRSDEGNSDGLGWLEADAVRFDFSQEQRDLRVPHMGWAPVKVLRPNPILGMDSMELRFYFVHSFHVVCSDPSVVIATADCGITFVAALQKGNIVATQFHPEKSHRYGLSAMASFARWNP